MKVYRDPSDPSILRIRDSNPTIIAPVIERINTDEKYEDYVARWIDTHPELSDQSISIVSVSSGIIPWETAKNVFIEALDDVISDIENLSYTNDKKIRKIKTTSESKLKLKKREGESVDIPVEMEESVGLPVDEEESIGLPGDEEESVGLPGDEEESVGLPGDN